MIIKSLKLQNYKQFEEKKLDFESGLNIVKGPNESGKSSVVGSLYTIFFTDATSRSRKDVSELAKWGSDELFKLTLNFEYKDKAIELTKDFVAKTSELTDLATSKKIKDSEKIQIAVNRALGIDSPHIFLSTSYVSQNQINALNITKDLQSALQKAILGNLDTNPYDGLSAMKEEYRKMGVGLTSPAKFPGILKSLQTQITEEESKLSKIKERIEVLKSAYTKGDSSEGEVTQLTEKISILEKEFENQKIYEEATKSLSELEVKANELGREISEVESLLEQKSKMDEAFISFKHFSEASNLDEIAERLSTINGEIKVLTEMFNGQQAEPEKKVQEPNRNKVIAQYALSLVSLVIGIVSYLLLDKWIAFAVGIVLAVLSYAVTRFIINKKPVEKKSEVSEKEQEKIDAASRIQTLQEELEQLLAQTDSNSSDEFFTNKAKFTALKEQLNEVQTYLDARLRGRTLEQMKKEQSEIFTKKAEIEQTKLTPEIVNARVLPEDYLRKRRELDMLQLDKKKLEEDLTASKVRIEDSEYSMDDLVSTEEKLAWLKADYAEAKKKYLALELAIKAMDKAIKETLSGSSRKLKEYIEKHLPEITINKYQVVELDENLSISVYSNEKGGLVDPTVLSAGTIDQIYLLARLAIIEMIDSEARCPLILDDPFVTFDKERLDMTKKLLTLISNSRQTFIFTCHDDYDKWGNLILL